MLDAFRVAKFRFDLQALDPLHLPAYKGSTFRGGFGYAFKELACEVGSWQDCNPCRHGDRCVYGYVFEPRVPEGWEPLLTQDEVPAPFVVEAAADSREHFAAGDWLSFDLVLIGGGIRFWPHFLAAFKRLGEMGIGKPRGRFEVIRMRLTHPWKLTGLPVFDGTSILTPSEGGMDPYVTGYHDAEEHVASWPDESVTLRFLTPTRVKWQGQFVCEPPFHVIVRSLLRRISALDYYHCGERLAVDAARCIADAERIQTVTMNTSWVDWDRFSGRQRQRIDVGGFVGEASYAGWLAPFRELIALAELVHVGKATVFGHGKVEVV